MNDVVNADMAHLSTQELLQELLTRGSLKRMEAQVTVDGRAIRKMVEDGVENSVVEASIEMRAMSILTAGMMKAGENDRVHTFDTEPAHGDLPPGSILASVRMLAVPLIHPTIIEEGEVDARAVLEG